MGLKFLFLVFIELSAHSEITLINVSHFFNNFSLDTYFNNNIVLNSIFHKNLENSSTYFTHNYNFFEPKEYLFENNKEENREVIFRGLISKDFWSSAIASGLERKYIFEFAKIFASEIDFSRELRPNDEWGLVIERVCNGEGLCYFNKILAAKLRVKKVIHYAFYFAQEGLEGSYFSLNGESLSRQFLKSPIDFARISSRFSRKRFHPILKIYRPHRGIDYAALTGTPVRAVSDGLITKAGWYGDAGNMVEINHFKGYRTAYKHLLKLAPPIKEDYQVKRGQIIGYVGRTGLATAPHLHFEFYKNGYFIDPLKLKFPPLKRIREEYMEDFLRITEKYKSLLEEWEMAFSGATGTG